MTVAWKVTDEINLCWSYDNQL